ncbi:hypothetical protein P691DRAFT_656375, partial [Macrolepiota fuliginosa MF-IS2]
LGIAACNIGGITIHSFSGIGLGNDTAEKLVDRVRKNKKAFMRWMKTKVLIIDEVSMVDGDLFDKLSRIGSAVRKRPSEPFGGIQVRGSSTEGYVTGLNVHARRLLSLEIFFSFLLSVRQARKSNLHLKQSYGVLQSKGHLT